MGTSLDNTTLTSLDANGNEQADLDFSDEAHQGSIICSDQWDFMIVTHLD
jgi:hypothetical protein